MHSWLAIVLCTCLILVSCSRADPLGVVLLDEVIFDKIINRFQVAVVKFDVAYPYGDKHEEFARFAREQNVLVEDLVIGDVHCKDYGDKENWALLKRFGIDESELPAILIIKKSDPSKWIRYPKDQAVTVDNLKNFVRKNTKLYIGLSGCIEGMDHIAASFMEKFNRNEFGDLDGLISEAIRMVDVVKEEQKSSAAVYVQVMKRIREKGISFKEEERTRVKKLLATKLTPQKKKELENRLNILISFRDTSHSSSEKEEL